MCEAVAPCSFVIKDSHDRYSRFWKTCPASLSLMCAYYQSKTLVNNPEMRHRTGASEEDMSGDLRSQMKGIGKGVLLMQVSVRSGNVVGFFAAE